MSKTRNKCSATPTNNIRKLCSDLGDLFDVLDDDNISYQAKRSESEFQKKKQDAFNELKRKLAEFS